MSATRKTAEQASRRRGEASRWFVALQKPEVSERELKAWKKWEAVPENRQVFDEIERLWARTDDVARPATPTPAALLTDRYDGSRPVSSWRAGDSGSTFSRIRFRAPLRYVGIAATLAFSVAGIRMVALDYWRPTLPGGHVAVFETAVAEHQEIVLSDGSRIQLGAKTSVTTNMGDRLRTVVLDRGEALFKVAHDASRPFKVMAGGGTITAIGTAFNVRRREDDHVVVTVTEGTVQITPSSLDAEREFTRATSVSKQPLALKRLEHGQQITYDLDGRFTEPQLADSDISLTWRDGRLQYRGELLRNVIPDVNRYSRRPIVLGDRAAGELLYSGTVFERDVEEWIGSLDKIYPDLEVTVTDADNVLIRTRPLTTKK